ncbi:DEAD/DEAH box helicase [Xylanimonas protaetiae]|uniref:DEAD/DEAH box helicase n=1 Tax=Xylanimonas protaetiae TaxID=2509457 RepID=UPI0013EBD72A|nr:DEAD/DEAH box helicase [Xylanimonas protaetiae]
MNAEYRALLERKAQAADTGGFEPANLPDHLFGFQRALVEWAVHSGRGAIFADCGLGKTPMELAWAEQVHRHTGRPVLLLTPLAVGFQVMGEAEKFGHDAGLSRSGRVAAAITVTNYEQLVAGKFDPSDFAGVVADESSAIKAFDGVTRAAVTEFMRRIPYRLLGTATAAPNDWTELGTSSESLGRLGYVDMLSRFFVNNQRTTTNRARFAAAGRDVGWRLKGHAAEPFWRWVSSWARAVRRPSDIGFDDDGYVLPELLERQTVIEATHPREGTLFDVPASGLAEEREETRRTLTERCETAAATLEHTDRAVAWCHLNDESHLLTQLIDGAVEVAGADSPGEKEDKLAAFTRGEIRVLVTKPSIGAWGLNWQHAHRMTYFPSHSYEQYYQAVRRMWRFGQTSPVYVDVITTTGGQKALANLQRKATQADGMFAALIEHMNGARDVARHTYDQPLEIPSWVH